MGNTGHTTENIGKNGNSKNDEKKKKYESDGRCVK